LRLDGSHVDTADTFSSNISDSDVTTLTPAGAPGVLDNPVSLVTFGSETNDQDTVVELSSAVSAVEDTTGVALEGTLVGFNGNGDWALADSSSQLVVIIRRDISVA